MKDLELKELIGKTVIINYNKQQGIVIAVSASKLSALVKIYGKKDGHDGHDIDLVFGEKPTRGSKNCWYYDTVNLTILDDKNVNADSYEIL